MLKSAIIFGLDNPLKFVVITESNLMTGFREKLEDWQGVARQMFTFEILPLTFPKPNEREWKSLFKPCSAQRLFLPVNTFRLYRFEVPHRIIYSINCHSICRRSSRMWIRCFTSILTHYFCLRYEIHGNFSKNSMKPKSPHCHQSTKIETLAGTIDLLAIHTMVRWA